MYTADPNYDDEDAWDVKDSDGDIICTVRNSSEAAALLSHLNRD
jgi:hypothetical protein